MFHFLFKGSTAARVVPNAAAAAAAKNFKESRPYCQFFISFLFLPVGWLVGFFFNLFLFCRSRRLGRLLAVVGTHATKTRSDDGNLRLYLRKDTAATAARNTFVFSFSFQVARMVREIERR